MSGLGYGLVCSCPSATAAQNSFFVYVHVVWSYKRFVVNFAESLDHKCLYHFLDAVSQIHTLPEYRRYKLPLRRIPPGLRNKRLFSVVRISIHVLPSARLGPVYTAVAQGPSCTSLIMCPVSPNAHTTVESEIWPAQLFMLNPFQ